MHFEPMDMDGTPTEEGIYVARRKMRNVFAGSGWRVVKVTRNGSAGPISVWQIGDCRPWPVEDWEWSERLFPDHV